MFVKVEILVKVDPKDWNDEYATDDEAPVIREQIKAMAVDAVRASMAHLPVEVNER